MKYWCMDVQLSHVDGVWVQLFILYSLSLVLSKSQNVLRWSSVLSALKKIWDTHIGDFRCLLLLLLVMNLEI